MTVNSKLAEKYQAVIDGFWESRASITPATSGEVREAVEHIITGLDRGEVRVATRIESGKWEVEQWIKKAVLLYFRLNDMTMIEGGPAYGGTKTHWFDKVPSKMQGWSESDFRAASFRAVSGCFVRKGSYIAPNVVLMPSFVNIGAYVGEGTMIDTWATVGSCAQIGKHGHSSGGAGIGGVLEPLQANPVVIEDNCFIGARAEVAEGVIVEEGSVISMGVYLGASTKIVDRETGEVMYGRVPAYSVVVPGTMPGKSAQSPSLYCAVIVKRVDEKTRSKTSINELLRGV